MAGSSLLALIDDIAALLDDVAVMSKVALKKTSGVLGDDLALNAEQVTGIEPNREIPVVLAVAKGSTINKIILVPAALGISALLPWAITPLLMAGGLFLCYEGFEKIHHKFFSPKDEEGQKNHQDLIQAVQNTAIDLVEYEKGKIKGAIRTDFILSAEIIVITLGTVADASLYKQFLVLSTIAILMTLGVYGLVAGIVKLDDLGLYLSRNSREEGSFGQGLQRRMGLFLLWLSPWLLKFLSLAGLIAMFLVGGGIISHGIPALHHFTETLDSSILYGLGSLASGVIGIISGALALLILKTVQSFAGPRKLQ